MLKFIYTTDLHGHKEKYEAVLKTAKNLGVSMIHLGADLLPKGQGMEKGQKKFINGYLKKYYASCKNEGIDVLAFFGNDDLYYFKKEFTKYASLLDSEPVLLDQYEFKAYGYVQDYPFRLKTACKLDHDGWWCNERQFGSPVDFNGTEMVEIPDIKKHFADKGTIERDLMDINATNRTIMAIHQPPWSLGLDVCADGRRVGSKAVYEWIECSSPLVVLCGHIHESLEFSGIWKAKIGNTLVIQPGQAQKNGTRLVYIELNGDTVKTELLDIPC